MGKTEGRKEILSLLQNREKAEEWVKGWVPTSIKSWVRDDIKEMINKGVSPATILFNHLSPYTKNPILKPLIRLVIRHYWNEIEKAIIDVKNIQETIIKTRPDLKDLFDNQKGRRWLNYATSTTYSELYKYTWV